LSAVTPVLTGMVSELIVEILLIVAALAAIVGIGVLVAYGFRSLRRVGGYDSGKAYYNELEDRDDVW
jgi:L-cystine uptake protein TcyP (sodium:dicarboxylate symporter family)